MHLSLANHEKGIEKTEKREYNKQEKIEAKGAVRAGGPECETNE